MNWQAISFDWNQVRAFLATAEEGSFSGAARALKTTQPTIGRQISGLEDALGVTLFERTVRGPNLTEAGQEILDHVRLMGETATLISAVAAGQSQEVKGDVSVTGTDLMSSVILPGLLGDLKDIAPGIHLRIIAANDIQNLMQREADIAIRHVRPTQPDLIARHIGDFRANLYAASTYLDITGRPRSARAVADLSFIGNPDSDQLLKILQDKGIPVRPENFTISSESSTVEWGLVKAGHGITFMPEFLGETTPGIEKVIPGLPSLEFPVWLVTHRELRTSRRIQFVFELLARGLTEAVRAVP